MGNIKKMLEDQRLGKRVKISDYYNDAFKFYDDLEIYSLINLGEKELQRELSILASTVKQENDDKIFYLDGPLPIEQENTYKIVFQQLLRLYLKDQQSAYEEAFRYVGASREFNKLINQFKLDYINADLFVPILVDISEHIRNYKEIETLKREKKKTYREELIDTVYDSNMSFIDYSFYNTLSSEFDKYMYRDLNKKNPKFIEITSRENKTEEQILQIIEKISNNEISILDYYEMTKLHPIFLTMIANKHSKMSNAFRSFIKNFNSTPVKVEIKKK